jgi:hypothetical protein
MSSASHSPALPVMGSLIVLVNKRADWNVPVSYIKCTASQTPENCVYFWCFFLVLKPQCTAKWHVFDIRNRHISVSSFAYKYDQWPHDSYMTGRAGNRWRHFTDSKSCQIIESILKYRNGFKNNLVYKEIFN